MAGLLAARMLRHHDPLVVEAQTSLPNNHSAVMRFRSHIVGDVLGIDFKKVSMIKSWSKWRNPVADCLAYSRKNLGTWRSDRSIISSGMETHVRYIAPPDLISRMAAGVEVSYGTSWNFCNESYGKVISTVPMPFLMGALNYPGKRDAFSSFSGYNLRATVSACDAYATVSVPNPCSPFSRVSITGDELIAEMPPDGSIDINEERVISALAREAASHLGMEDAVIFDVSVRHQKYAKIAPLPEAERREFIYWASTATGRAYSLGRFATWRPGLVMDDLVKDVRLIDSWIKGDSYSQSMRR